MTSNNTEQTATIPARGGWHETYAQAQADTQATDQHDPDSLHCIDEQIAALRAALRASTGGANTTGLRYRNRPHIPVSI